MSIEAMPTMRILNRCAEAWELGDLTFVRKMENIVFSSVKGQERVFLRLTSPLRRNRAEIEAELNWIEHLAKSGVRVPKIVLDRQGNRMNTFRDDVQHFEAVLFLAVDGQHPTEDIAADPEFLRTLGALIAKMHMVSERYDEAHREQKREQWDVERGLRHAKTAAATTNEQKLKRKFLEAIAWIKTLPKRDDTYGLVHADLGALNLFVEDDRTISIIDFDDSCYHFYAFDLAIVIYSMAGRFHHASPKLIERMWLGHLLDGYRTLRQISPEEIDWIPKFMEFAALRLYFWIEHHQTLNTFHDEAVNKITELKQWAAGRIIEP